MRNMAGVNSMEKRDFFISYTQADKAWAVWIADVLKKNGYSVYVQALDILPGDDFLAKMEEFLENSENFIAVWSEGYSKSGYCMNEMRAAFHQCHNGRMKRLLPVRIDTHPMLALYAALVHVDLSDMSKASERKLMDAVRSIVSCPDVVIKPEEDANTLYQHGEDCYYGKNGMQKNYVKAREYYEKAAAKGHAESLYYLGTLYEYGRGVSKNYTKALEYYENAAYKRYKYAPAKVLELRNKLRR